VLLDGHFGLLDGSSGVQRKLMNGLRAFLREAARGLCGASGLGHAIF